FRSALAQGVGDHVADRGFVIDDEDAFLHGVRGVACGADPAITRRFRDTRMTLSPGAQVPAQPAADLLVADALPAQLQHGRGDRGDPRLDPAARVVVQVAALLQVVQLYQRLLRPAAQVG